MSRRKNSDGVVSCIGRTDRSASWSRALRKQLREAQERPRHLWFGDDRVGQCDPVFTKVVPPRRPVF